MAFTLIARTLLAHRIYQSSLSLAHKPQIFTSFSNKKSTICTSAVLLPPSSETLADNVLEQEEEAKSSTDFLRQWGCSDDEISKMFSRRPSLRSCNITNLKSKLEVFSEMGLKSSDLVRIVNCRPRFLSSRIDQPLNHRLKYLQDFFGSKDVLNKAIIRNPSLLLYDYNVRVKPIVDLYDNMGVKRKDMIQMLLSRPTIISRSSFNDEKLDYIRKTNVSKDSKMYKYVVTIIAISKLETIREKIANFEKFGFSVEEVMRLIGKTPLLLTLSTNKVQRNMTFVLGTMKLEARIILNHPYLLYSNLESVLKPRVLLARKIEKMGIYPQMKGGAMLTAIRMKEERFCNAFINCHPFEIACELMEFYKNAKSVKRIGAESLKKTFRKCFPF